MSQTKKITDGTVTGDIADSTDTDGNIDSKVIRNIIDDITNQTFTNGLLAIKTVIKDITDKTDSKDITDLTFKKDITHQLYFKLA